MVSSLLLIFLCGDFYVNFRSIWGFPFNLDFLVVFIVGDEFYFVVDENQCLV